MKTLPLIIKRDGFTYTQLIRRGMFAVYSQWKGRILAYETIRIQSHNGYEVAGTPIPAAESMPSASAWGIHGFTFPTKEEAIKRLALMVARG